MSGFDLRLFGPLRLRQEDGEVITSFRTHRAMALLVYLVCNCRHHPRSELVELIWPDKSDKRGRANLRWALNYLSNLLPDAIESTRRTVRFRVSNSNYVDLIVLKNALNTGDLAMLGDFLCDERQPLMAGFYFDESREFERWLVLEREAWRRRIADALQQLLQHHNRRGEYVEALVYARNLVALDPWQEQAHRQVMNVLARQGQYQAALDQYERCRRILSEELGTRPREATEALRTRIQILARTPRPRLPAQPTPFVGRERELATLIRMLHADTCRCVTIVGLGGIGKTRLALEVAQRVQHAFLDGVYFVPLAPLKEPLLLETAIAAALDLTLDSEQPARQQIIDHVRAREILLILDNVEQALDDISFLADILSATDDTRLLITSRERLNMRWEQVFDLRGLPVDDTKLPSAAAISSDAGRLFLNAARRVRYDFTLTPENAPAIQRICRLVDGMPLALELAGALVREQSCAQIADNLSSTLDVLTTTMRDVPARHRSVRAVFNHLWTRLPPSAQHTLHRLSLFQGPFSARAAHYVTSTRRATLRQLITQSLVRRIDEDYFELHELLQQYAAESTSQPLDATCRRHSQYYLEFVAEQADALCGAGSREAITRIQRELDNVRAGWKWAVEHAEIALISRGIVGLSRFYTLTGLLQEAEHVFAAAANALDERDPADDRAVETLARLLAEQAFFLNRTARYDLAIAASQRAVDLTPTLTGSVAHTAGLMQIGYARWQQGDYDEARRRFEDVQTQAQSDGVSRLHADSLYALGVLAANQSRYDDAVEQLTAALQRYEELGDWRGKGKTVRRLGTVYGDQGDLAQAQIHFMRAHEIAQVIGDRRGAGTALHDLGFAVLYQGEYERAKAHFGTALAIFREIGDRQYEASTLLALGNSATRHGDYAGARKYYERALRLNRDIGHRRHEAYALSGIGQTALHRGTYNTAEVSLRDAIRMYERIGHKQGAAWVGLYRGILALHVGDYETASCTLTEVLAAMRRLGDRRGEAYTLVHIALLAHQRNDNGAAEVYSRTSIEIAEEIGIYTVLTDALTVLGHALLGQGDTSVALPTYERALDMYGKRGHDHPHVDALAGTIRAAMAAGDMEQALAGAAELADVLEAGPPDGALELFRVYLTCCRALRDTAPAHAEQILTAGYQALQDRAARLLDSQRRRTFLEQVPAHSRLIHRYEECSGHDL